VIRIPGEESLRHDHALYDGRVIKVLDRSRSRLPRPVRTALDWLVTLAAAVAFILAFEAEIAKPYRIPTSSMEPTLHCARPAPGCRARFADRVIVNRLAYRIREPRRTELVVFHAPPSVAAACGGAAGDFVKRIVGLPNETVELRSGFVFIDGIRLDERSYIKTTAQRARDSGVWHVKRGHYFVLGDNRSGSCDSRAWGLVARDDLVGPVLLTYWPPQRASIDGG
jgi:signal peptidase I